MTSLYSTGFLRSLLTSFNAVAELQTVGAELLGMAPGGAVESKLGSNPSHIGVTFPTWLTSEGAIGKHEPFNLQTATETNEPTRFVRALSDGLALVCQPGLGNTRATNRRP
jgi:hypothetical protein